MSDETSYRRAVRALSHWSKTGKQLAGFLEHSADTVTPEVKRVHDAVNDAAAAVAALSEVRRS